MKIVLFNFFLLSNAATRMKSAFSRIGTEKSSICRIKLRKVEADDKIAMIEMQKRGLVVWNFQS